MARLVRPLAIEEGGGGGGDGVGVMIVEKTV
jgi:hypothetical protein